MPRLTRRANNRDRGKWRDNPLVPIDGARVREALDLSGRSLPELARQLGERRQTLDYVVRSATTRCRQGRRAAIARALGVSDAWLGGAGDAGMEWLVGRLMGTSQALRAINRLGRRCEAALQRDGRPLLNATSMLQLLTLPDYWRGALMSELSPELFACEDLGPLERDLVKTALANALEAILRPWLTGHARLDYRALERLVPIR